MHAFNRLVCHGATTDHKQKGVFNQAEQVTTLHHIMGVEFQLNLITQISISTRTINKVHFSAISKRTFAINKRTIAILKPV